MKQHAASRRNTMRVSGLGLVIMALMALWVSCTSARAVGHGLTTASIDVEPVEDIVITGTADGSVYGLDAWTGEVLWMFDSGGAMLDISQCRIHEAAASSTSSASSSSSSGSGSGSRASSSLTKTKQEGIVAEVIPSLDGRLFHISSMNKQFRQLDITVIDLVNANGPIRLQDDNLSDVLFFGEKHTKLFTVDVIKGVVLEPFASHRESTRTLFFGRSEYKTRMVDTQNPLVARCITISEFFVQFASNSRCSYEQKQHLQEYLPPEIYVEKNDDSVEPITRIVGYHPLTGSRLWEWRTAKDLNSLHGISASRGLAFYEWSIRGPSALAAKREPNHLLLSQASYKKFNNNREQLALDDAKTQVKLEVQVEADGNFALGPVRGPQKIHHQDASEEELRLRLVEGSYFLESHELGSSSGSLYFDSSTFEEEQRLKHGWKDRKFWKPMENDGKKGVFITYKEVAAMIAGIVLACVLIAWSCYVMGLSNSLAKTAIKTIDKSKFFVSHVHQLTIDRPGQERVTISSVISRSLVSENSLMLLEDEEAMSNFSKVAATEAASILSGEKPAGSQLRLALGQSSYFSNIQMPEQLSSPFLLDNKPSVAVEEESFFTSEQVEFIEEEDDGIEELVLSPGSNSSHNVNLDNNNNSSSSSTIHESEHHSEDPVSDSSTTTFSEKSSKSSKSNVSNSDKGAAEAARKSSSSSSNDADTEVLIPYVCQSRFANEFKEISAIGKGGFGQVILAENRLDGRKYAIKRVGLNLKNQTSKTLQKFLREVKILALLDHPNIVRYYQAWLERIDVVNDVGTDKITKRKMPVSNSTGNLLAPISERDFISDDHHSSSSSDENDDPFSTSRRFFMEEDSSDGFEWERGPEENMSDNAWKEEDLSEEERVAWRHYHDKRSVGGSKRLFPVKHRSRDSSSRLGRYLEPDSTGNQLEQCDHWLYIQMQYCAGRNLGDFLAIPTRPRDIWRMLRIFTQITSALAHVHSCGLIHRDLKPANIFVADAEADSIKLGDFGLSRYAANVNMNMGHSLSSSSANSTVNSSEGSPASGEQVSEDAPATPLPPLVPLNETARSLSWSRPGLSSSGFAESTDNTAGVGTYLYASPEQVAGKKYSSKTDMYSLGMILFEMCCDPFVTTMERYNTLRSAREGVFGEEFSRKMDGECPEMLRMLSLLLAKDPATRPNAEEVMAWSQQLYDVLQLQQVQQQHSQQPQQPQRLRSPLHKPLNGTSSFVSTNENYWWIGNNARMHHDEPHVENHALHALHRRPVNGNCATEKTLVLQVEAKSEDELFNDGLTTDALQQSPRQRVPNHNLLRDICELISQLNVHGKMEIKRCGVQVQDGGVQVLEFELEADGKMETRVIASIEALASVKSVWQLSESGQ